MNERFTRRGFLQTLAVVTASAALPILDEPARAAPARGTAVGDVRQFKSGEWKPVTLSNGTGAFVRRQPLHGLQALSAVCTHKGCPVAWRPAQKQFVCPCHGGKFDANGKNVAGPPPGPLKSLGVTVVKGVVRVGG